MVNYRPQKLLGILAPTQYARVAKPSPRFRVRVWLRDWFLPFLVAALGTQSHCNAATIGMLSDGRCFCDSYGLDAFAQKNENRFSWEWPKLRQALSSKWVSQALPLSIRQTAYLFQHIRYRFHNLSCASYRSSLSWSSHSLPTDWCVGWGADGGSNGLETITSSYSRCANAYMLLYFDLDCLLARLKLPTL